MPLDMIGSWILTLETNSELGKASLDVPLEVVEPEGFDLILLLAGGVAILALVVWIRDRIGKGRSQSGS
jgi:cyanate permease